MEGNFLSELVDYANTTISRDILLNVPDVNEELGWFGLQPNAKYFNFNAISFSFNWINIILLLDTNFAWKQRVRLLFRTLTIYQPI